MPPEVWLPLLTLVLGYAFSQVTEAVRNRWQSDRERRAREDERAAVKPAQEEAGECRRRDFQRETLLELQEVLHDLGRAYGAEHFVDVNHGRETGSWAPKAKVGEEINTQSFEANRRSNILVARIDDEELRDHVRAMKDAGGRITLARSEPESNEAMDRSFEAFQRANERIGHLLMATFEVRCINRGGLRRSLWSYSPRCITADPQAVHRTRTLPDRP
jgi:hypothetical protein